MSPRYEKRDRLLGSIDIIRKWEFPQLHILVTSRDEVDIRNELQPASNEDIIMKNTGVEEDIADFISDHLSRDRRLSKWRPHRDQIKEALTKGAKGV